MGKISDYYRQIRFLVRSQGLLWSGATCIADLLAASRLLPKKRLYLAIKQGGFDAKHGLDTVGSIPPEDLDLDNEQRRGAEHYEPTDTMQLLLSLSRIRVPYEESVFVDFGSGKGRALMMAAQFPFKRIVGVEISRKLHEIAETNLRLYRRRLPDCPPIESTCANAMAFAIPTDPLVLYFYNPFQASVLSDVLDNIHRSWLAVPRPIVVLYYNPVHRKLFDEADFLSGCTRVPPHPRWAVYENHSHA